MSNCQEHHEPGLPPVFLNTFFYQCFHLASVRKSIIHYIVSRQVNTDIKEWIKREIRFPNGLKHRFYDKNHRVCLDSFCIIALHPSVSRFLISEKTDTITDTDQKPQQLNTKEFLTFQAQVPKTEKGLNVSETFLYLHTVFIAMIKFKVAKAV